VYSFFVVSKNKTLVSQFFCFFGVFLVLMGLYGALRIVHIRVRSVPYPQKGVFPATFLLPGEYSSFGRESDCNPYPQVYYDLDGKTARPPTPDEVAVSQEQTKRCIAGFDEDRSKAEQYDKNQAAFLIFVGLGLVASRRFL